MGKAMVTIATAPIGSPESKAAEAILNTDRSYHSMLRTTCVATLLDGGHANNALPQRAGPMSIAASSPVWRQRTCVPRWKR
jgi:hypothetical protein